MVNASPVEENDGYYYTLDKTYQEIKQAALDGKFVYLSYNNQSTDSDLLDPMIYLSVYRLSLWGTSEYSEKCEVIFGPIPTTNSGDNVSNYPVLHYGQWPFSTEEATGYPTDKEYRDDAPK